MVYLQRIGLSCLLSLILVGCNTYKPTGNAGGAVAGAVIGGGVMALTHSAKPWVGVGAIVGSAAGYYATTLTFDAAGITKTGGQVYQVGDYTGIYLPADNLFEVDTAEFLPQATTILDSVVAVLERQPNNNILVSGNTSGFYRSRWEQRLSVRRAGKITAYLWHKGINQFQHQSTSTRKLQYVGYGDYFPIASTVTNQGIRENNRIQITSYPIACDLGVSKTDLITFNIGAWQDNTANGRKMGCYKGEC